MAGAQLNFQLSGQSDAQRYLTYMAAQAENTLPLMQAFGHEGMQQSIRRFDEQRGPDGQAWVQSAAARKANRKTLIDSGHFKGNTFSSEATETEASWGTNAVQGAIFQLGGDIKMPAREGTARLRTRADGSLMRQSDGADAYAKRLRGLAVFAKPSHKRVKAVDFKAEAYTIHVVARPYLGVNAANEQTFSDMALAHIVPRGLS